MELPKLLKTGKEEILINGFSGIDRREYADIKHLFDAVNITDKSYPASCVRLPRAALKLDGNTIYNMASLDILHGGQIIKGAFVIYTGNRLKAYFNDGEGFSEHVLMSTMTTLVPGVKQLVLYGTRLYFFPDGFCVNLMDPTDKFRLGYTKTQALGISEGRYNELCLTRCDIDGVDSEEGEYGRVELKCYLLKSDGTKGAFLQNEMLSTSVHQGDTVEITGFGKKSLDGFYNIVSIDQGYRYFIIKCPETCTASVGEYTLQRKIPTMDFVVACGNRLWGCRYGLDDKGNSVNEIYASAYGDPTNWYRFEGRSDDSWTSKISSGGAFTGAAVFGGKPVFFKEDAVIKVLGSRSGDLTVVETGAPGVEAGSDKSIAVINNELYYKSRSGIMKYDGTLPRTVSAALGSEKYSNAVAGSLDGVYYVAMKDGSGASRLYIYNTANKLWHIEDDPGVTEFCQCGANMLMLCERDGESTVYTAGGVLNGAAEDDFDIEKAAPWMMESRSIMYDRPEHKYVSGIVMRMSLDIDAAAEVRIKYDDEGTWHTVRVLRGGERGIASIKFRPHRCSSFKIRISGRGDMSLHSLLICVEKCNGFGSNL